MFWSVQTKLPRRNRRWLRSRWVDSTGCVYRLFGGVKQTVRSVSQSWGRTNRFARSFQDGRGSVRSKSVALVLVAGVTFVCGCGRTEPQFSYREGLSPRMQEYVRTSVDQKFGTPHKIRVWDKLPIQPHAAVATVAEGSKDSHLVVQVSETYRDIQKGQEVAWIAGSVMPRGSATGLSRSLRQREQHSGTHSDSRTASQGGRQDRDWTGRDTDAWTSALCGTLPALPRGGR